MSREAAEEVVETEEDVAIGDAVTEAVVVIVEVAVVDRLELEVAAYRLAPTRPIRKQCSSLKRCSPINSNLHQPWPLFSKLNSRKLLPSNHSSSRCKPSRSELQSLKSSHS